MILNIILELHLYISWKATGHCLVKWYKLQAHKFNFLEWSKKKKKKELKFRILSRLALPQPCFVGTNSLAYGHLCLYFWWNASSQANWFSILCIRLDTQVKSFLLISDCSYHWAKSPFLYRSGYVQGRYWKWTTSFLRT